MAFFPFPSNTSVLLSYSSSWHWFAAQPPVKVNLHGWHWDEVQRAAALCWLLPDPFVPLGLPGGRRSQAGVAQHFQPVVRPTMAFLS